MFQQTELTLFSRIQCEACGSVLEVVEEDPLEVQVADDDFLAEDDDFDEDDDDDDEDQ